MHQVYSKMIIDGKKIAAELREELKKKVAEIKCITLAPELKGADKLINYLYENKINIQFGHTLANYDCCKNIADKTTFIRDWQRNFSKEFLEVETCALWHVAVCKF